MEFKIGDRVYQKGGDPEDWGEVTHINEHGLIVDLNGAMEVTVKPEDVLLRTWRHRAAQVVRHNWRIQKRLPRLTAFMKSVYRDIDEKVLISSTDNRVVQVNRILKSRGIAERLRSGGTYYFFTGGNTGRWPATAVYVFRANELSVERWLKEYEDLKGDER